MLSPQQLAHFDTFGFVHLRAVFSPAEVGRLQAEAADALQRASERYEPGNAKTWARMLSDRSPFYQGLGEDERLAAPARQMFGNGALHTCCDTAYYSGDTRWHNDHGIDLKLDCNGVKFLLYLDPLTPTTGGIRFVPGSHREPLFSALAAARADSGDTGLLFGEPPQQLPCEKLTTHPGDVVGFNMRCLHGAFGGGGKRWLSTVCFYGDPRTADEELGFRWRAVANGRHMLERPHPEDTLYHPDWVANKSHHPGRARTIDRLRELGYLAIPRPEDKATMDEILERKRLPGEGALVFQGGARL
eukprot:SAG31_NODE_804_length_11973_cov_8.406855_3_plen_302_part_00